MSIVPKTKSFMQIFTQKEKEIATYRLLDPKFEISIVPKVLAKFSPSEELLQQVEEYGFEPTNP